MRTKARLELQCGKCGEWYMERLFATYDEAAKVREVLTEVGILATVSCECGAYEYGACEGCNPPVKWELFCKRTEDPKLTWIEVQLDALGIPNQRCGESFHAPILKVPSDRMAEAEALLQKRVGRYTIDDIRDDHPRWTKDPLVRARLSHG